MGKALVLQNVNFSENKLGTVTFSDPVPCTGISLSSNTISFTKLGTSTLTATLTPSDTTDQLTWATSDNTVATVANGVVTAVGLGTATITATCGNQSATCSVSVTVTLTDSDFAILDHMMLTGTDISQGKDHISSYTSTADAYKKLFIYLASDSTPSGYRALSGSDEYKKDKYPFIIPLNATKIEVEGTNSVTIASVSITFANSTELCTYVQSASDKGCKAVINNATTYASNNKAVITIPDNVEGLDSFAMHITLSVGQETTPEGVTITFTDD